MITICYIIFTSFLCYLFGVIMNAVVLSEHKSDLRKIEMDSLVELVTVFLFFVFLRNLFKAKSAPLASGLFHEYFKI